VIEPSPSPPPATPPASAERTATDEAAKAKAEAKAKAKAKAKVKLARARVNQHVNAPTPPPTLPPESNAAAASVAAIPRPTTDQDHELLASPLLYALLVAAAGLALVSMALAALPSGALERLLATEVHYRSEQVADFVDEHRLEITMASVGTLLVAAVVALPGVTG
jgi:hypothetical protein